VKGLTHPTTLLLVHYHMEENKILESVTITNHPFLFMANTRITGCIPQSHKPLHKQSRWRGTKFSALPNLPLARIHESSRSMLLLDTDHRWYARVPWPWPTRQRAAQKRNENGRATPNCVVPYVTAVEYRVRPQRHDHAPTDDRSTSLAEKLGGKDDGARNRLGAGLVN
jgi:hypothetical protein